MALEAFIIIIKQKNHNVFIARSYGDYIIQSIQMQLTLANVMQIMSFWVAKVFDILFDIAY